MRAYVLLVIATIALIALAVSHLNKPLQSPLAIDARSPGHWQAIDTGPAAWPTWAAAKQPEMIEKLICIRSFEPSDQPREETRT